MKRIAIFGIFLCLAGGSSLAAGKGGPVKVGEALVVSRLVSSRQQLIDNGLIELDFAKRHGYLASVLKAFDVPLQSQLLVFSKTSQLRDHINPENPRAVYFNDQVYVAWVPGTRHIEIAAVEPDIGSVFYELEQKQQKLPKFKRSGRCIECHTASRSLGVPGPLVRSFPTDEEGAVDRSKGVSRVTHSTPIEDRWGGWYATGNARAQLHRGNRFGRKGVEAEAASVTDLREFLDVAKYPTASSDMVAILVLEHQSHMQNLITRLHRSSVAAMAKDGNIRQLKDQAETLLKYLLFVDEAPLKGPVRGSTDFARIFQARGINDGKGRSLRDFDLKRRLFKYPCSYLIYSDSFKQMHPAMRDYLWRRLHIILTGQDNSPVYDNLTAVQRRNIREILTATVPALPEYWKLGTAVEESK